MQRDLKICYNGGKFDQVNKIKTPKIILGPHVIQLNNKKYYV